MCLEKLHAWNGASLLFMFNMKTVSVTIQSPLKSNYALCVGTTLRAYETPTRVRVYKTPLNYLFSIEVISFKLCQYLNNFSAPKTASLYERKMTEGQMIKKIYLRSVVV
jgi:hypothetical protein